MLEKYITKFSEIWPEESVRLRELLTGLYQVQNEQVFEQFCEHIVDIIQAKDLAKLQLSINLARRMNFMILGEPEKSQDVKSGKLALALAIGIMIGFVIFYFLYL